MYFFDIFDYYIFNPISWSEVGISGGVVGCGGGVIPSDWDDLFSTATATRDAFVKSTYLWFITAAQTGYTENIDQGCSPTYLDLWEDYIQKKIEFEKYLAVFRKTIYLFRFNYDYNLIAQSGSTYEEYFETSYITYGQETGTTIGNVNEIINPLTGELSAVTVTYDYGTSFENTDLEILVNNYDNSMKQMMCSIKNMWSVIDGDTFDELWVDNNGDFVPNSGTTYLII